MKKTFGAVCFALVGISTVSVSAFNNIPLKGSNETRDFTINMLKLTECPNAVGLSLDSRVWGESASYLRPANCNPPCPDLYQQVAPMDRFLSIFNTIPDGQDNACLAPDTTQ